MCPSRAQVAMLRGATMLLLAWLTLAGTAVPQQVSRAWTVKEVMPPEPFQAGDEFVWGKAFGCGDPDRDGREDWIALGQNQPDPGFGRHGKNLAVVWTGLGDRVVAKTINMYAGLAGGWASQYSALLRVFRSGQPDVWIALDIPWYISPFPIEFYSLLSGKRVGEARAAFPPPGFLSLADYGLVTWAGDLDGDGCDDLFYQAVNIGNGGRYSVAGMVDGERLETVWEDYMADWAGDAPTWRTTPLPPSDLNGDLVPAYVASVTNY